MIPSFQSFAVSYIHISTSFLTEGRGVCHWPYLLWLKWEIKFTVGYIGRFSRALLRTANQVGPFRITTVCTFSWSGKFKLFYLKCAFYVIYLTELVVARRTKMWVWQGGSCIAKVVNEGIRVIYGGLCSRSPRKF